MKFINKKLLKYLPQIIAMLFLAGFVAYAWTEPSSVPPDGNVVAPIKVGTSPQLKAGSLGIGGVCKNIWPDGGAGKASASAVKDFLTFS